MPTPKRQLIREATKQLLLDASITEVGTNIFSNRVSAFWRSELPCISIFIKNEEASPRDLSNKSFIRKATLSFEVHAEAVEDLDNTLDSIADSIETVMNDNPTLNNTISSHILQDTEIELSGEATTPIGVLSINYQITYIK